jgi:dolichol-phosphate mannosyltransferase
MPPAALSVIVPTYNERDSLPILLERLARVGPGVVLEVVVVDDGSPDGTGALAEEFARTSPVPVHVVHRPAKAGLASAVVAGAAVARGATVTVMDADLSHPPELLPDLAAAAAGGADIVVASRYVPGGGIEAWPLPRRIVSRVATALARVGLGLRVRDPLSGYFTVRPVMLKGEAYRQLGYKLLMEILAIHPGARVVEIPYRFVDRGRGASKLSSGEIVNFLRLLIDLRLRRGPWSSGHS